MLLDILVKVSIIIAYTYHDFVQASTTEFFLWLGAIHFHRRHEPVAEDSEK